MAVYTHLTQQQLEQLAHRYGFSELHSAQGIAEGVENSNYLLQGNNFEGQSTKAILTLFEKRIQPTDLPFFIDLMRHLSAKGLCCPSPLTMENGSLTGTIEGKAYAMVSFLPGKSVVSPNTEQCFQLGEAMARLHLAGLDAPLRRANDLSFTGWQRIATALLPRLDSLHPELPSVVENELLHLSAAWPANLPKGIIHADLFPDNVFFNDTILSGIIDFYFACEDALAYDIAISINSWCFDDTKRGFEAAKASALIAGYEQVRPLSASERSALPVLLRGAALRFLLTRAHDWIHHDATAIVTPHDPMEYLHKLRLWQQGVFST